MFVQTQNTPNPNSLKFVPGKKVSKIGPVEVLDLKDTNNELIRNILSINGILSVFLYEDFLSVNKRNNICLLYTSPSPRDGLLSRMPSSA